MKKSTQSTKQNTSIGSNSAKAFNQSYSSKYGKKKHVYQSGLSPVSGNGKRLSNTPNVFVEDFLTDDNVNGSSSNNYQLQRYKQSQHLNKTKYKQDDRDFIQVVSRFPQKDCSLIESQQSGINPLSTPGTGTINKNQQQHQNKLRRQSQQIEAQMWLNNLSSANDRNDRNRSQEGFSQTNQVYMKQQQQYQQQYQHQQYYKNQMDEQMYNGNGMKKKKQQQQQKQYQERQQQQDIYQFQKRQKNNSPSGRSNNIKGNSNGNGNQNINSNRRRNVGGGGKNGSIDQFQTIRRSISPSKGDRLKKKLQINGNYMDQQPMSMSMSPYNNNATDDILIDEQIQEDLNMMQEYRELERQYLQELQTIKQETDKIRKECDIEKSRIADSEQNLVKKRNKLRSLEESYQLIVGGDNADGRNGEESKMVKSYEQKIIELKQNYQDTKQRNAAEVIQLQEEYKKVLQENESLTTQLSNMEKQLAMYEKDMPQEIFKQKMKCLQQQETQNLEKIKQFKQKTAKLKEELSSVQATKPISIEMHKKYLDLYEKTFIITQIKKAEEILKMKDNERMQLQEFDRRKLWVKDKKIQITLREKRVNQKNRQIDKLIDQVKEKSRQLVDIYNQHMN